MEQYSAAYRSDPASEAYHAGWEREAAEIIDTLASELHALAD